MWSRVVRGNSVVSRSGFRGGSPLSIALILVVVAALLASLGGTRPASAATVREASARWADGTAGSVHQGETLTSEWRFNLNSDAAAPSNNVIQNVYATITATNGTFSRLPDACLTTGVTPVSAISADGTAIVCNFGAQKEGTALAVQIPVVANGPVDSKVSLSAVFGEASASTTPIPIVKNLDIDFKLSEPDAWYQATGTSDYQKVEFPWSLYLGNGSLTGPDTLTYTITATATNAAALLTGSGSYGCSSFSTTGNLSASGHPWSGSGHPADQTANFVTDCQLARIGTTNQFTLTLSGINWSVVNAPTKDSAGNPLPADAKVVASGVIFFQINPADNASTAGLTVQANTPTYTAPADSTASVVDDGSNNTASKIITFNSGWSGIWGRGGTGTSSWDDQLRASPGATLSTYSDSVVLRSSHTVSQCTILDTKYVTATGPAVVSPVGGAVSDMGPYTVYYYVGTTPAALDPTSASYNPDAVATCGDLPTAGWTTTLPADLSTVKAVRVDYNMIDMTRLDRVALKVPVQVHADVAIGQDIWVWHSRALDGSWSRYAAQVTSTPNARYPYTTQSRDIVRVIAASPAIAKSVDRTVIHMGDTATFTLTYSANGGTFTSPTVPGYSIVDNLPLGLSYVPGSSTPEPTVTTAADGHQVLTWTFATVPTNTANTLTYQVTTNSTTTAGVVMKNSAVASIATNTTIGKVSSPPASATVTVDTAGTTVIGKSADQALIPNLTGNGVGSGSWTVSLRADDPSGQTFTDVIDILPYNGDGRGTSFSGSYAVSDVIANGATVYYTTTAPGALSDDPANASNGAAGTVTGNSVGWTTTKPADPSTITAIRVIGGALAPTETRTFQVFITTDGAKGGDTYVNRAQGRASHTELVMRTSAPTTVSRFYAYDLKKYVQDAAGQWHDAQDTNPVDWPSFSVGVTSVNYKIVVTNTGQGDLSNITVTDALFPQGNHTIASLPSGQSNEYQFTADLSTYAAGTVRNVATAHTPLPSDTSQTQLPDPSDEANVTLTDLLGPIHVVKQGLQCDVGQPTCPLNGADYALYSSDPSAAGAQPIAGGITPDTAGGSTFISTRLTPGTYWLVETKAPEGFTLLPTPIQFTVSTAGVSLVDSGSAVVTLQQGDNFTIVVSDAPASQLPKAGGEGPWPNILVALLLFGAGAIAHHQTSGRRIAPRRARD